MRFRLRMATDLRNLANDRLFQEARWRCLKPEAYCKVRGKRRRLHEGLVKSLLSRHIYLTVLLRLILLENHDSREDLKDGQRQYQLNDSVAKKYVRTLEPAFASGLLTLVTLR